MLRTFFMRNIYSVCFIFVVAQAYENILTTKISRFTVCTRQEDLGNEARFPKVIITVQCSICSQLNNKP